MSNYPQLRKREIQEVPNRLVQKVYGDETAIEPLDFKEVPTVAERLGIKDLLAEPQTFIKAHGLENFIKDRVEEEGLRSGEVGFNTIFQRMISRLPESYEVMVRSNRGLEVLNYLFQEAALQNQLSSESYLKEVGEDNKYRRVTSLLNKLKIALTTI